MWKLRAFKVRKHQPNIKENRIYIRAKYNKLIKCIDIKAFMRIGLKTINQVILRVNPAGEIIRIAGVSSKFGFPQDRQGRLVLSDDDPLTPKIRSLNAKNKELKAQNEQLNDVLKSMASIVGQMLEEKETFPLDGSNSSEKVKKQLLTISGELNDALSPSEAAHESHPDLAPCFTRGQAKELFDEAFLQCSGGEQILEALRNHFYRAIGVE